MTDDEVFDLATTEHGGRCTNSDFSDVKRVGDEIVEMHRASHYFIKPFPKIIVDTIESPNFNALATKFKEHYIIGVNKAVIIILTELFNRLLSHPEIITTVGNVNEELKYSEKITDYYTNIWEMVNANKEIMHRKPVNKSRQIYANHLTRIAIEFIIEHELTHVLHGHVDYVNSLGYTREITEINSEIENNLDRQTLEWDADAFACWMAFKRALQVFNNKEGLSSEFHFLFQSIEDALIDDIYAIYSSMRLFGDGDYKNMTPGKSNHPDPRIRQLSAISILNPFLKRYLPQIDSGPFFSKLFDKIIIDCEFAYEKITGNSFNGEVLDPKYYAHNPLAKAVTENWKNKIWKELQPYSFKLLPPT